MEAFLKGIVLGWGVSAPIGPINVLIMSYALKSYTKAVVLGFGAMSADALYLLLPSFGVLKFSDYAIFFKLLSLCGALYLSYMAYDIYKSAGKEVKIEKEAKFGSHFKIFVKGFLLNITNPYVVMFWLSIATVTASIASFTMALLGLVVGILSWIMTLSFVIYKSRNLISAKPTKALSYASALILVGFALMLVYENLIKGSL